MIAKRSQDTFSVISNNIANNTFMADLSFETGDDEDPKQLTYSKAVMNAYRFWLLSGRWDYVRQPGYAGFFDRWCNEFPMTSDGESQLVQSLTSKTELAFGGMISLNDVTAKADVISRRWSVSVEPVDVATGLVGKSDKPEEATIVVDTTANKVLTSRDNVDISTSSNTSAARAEYVKKYKSDYTF